MEIREFIEARLAEDEATAQHAIDQGGVGRAGEAHWTRIYSDRRALVGDMAGNVVIHGIDDSWSPSSFQVEHIIRHDPARVLREVAAKRAVIADLDRARAQQKQHPKDLATTGWMLGMMRALDFLALAWEDHPDFDPAWRING